MEPSVIVAGAIAAGAAAALKDTASKAIKDAYAGLVALIKDCYKAHTHVKDAVEHLARKPQDKGRRASLESELKAAPVPKEAQEPLTSAAKSFLQAVEQADPDAARAVGVDIEVLTAAEINFSNIGTPGHGTAVRIGEARTDGTATFSGIGSQSPPKH